MERQQEIKLPTKDFGIYIKKGFFLITLGNSHMFYGVFVTPAVVHGFN